MAETGRTEDGGYAIRTSPEGPWEEVDEATYETAQQGRLERTARSFGSNVVDSVSGLVGLGYSPLGYEESGAPLIGKVTEALDRSNDAAQNARMRLDAPAAIGGMIGEALLPVPPVAAAARRGRAITSSDVDAVRTGSGLRPTAQRFSDTAERVVEGSRARSLSAAGRATSSGDFATTDRALDGMLTPEELDDLSGDLSVGKLYTPGDAAALRAPAGDDSILKAEALREREELFRRNTVLDRAAGRGESVNAIRDNAGEAAQRRVLAELGEPVGTRLTATTMRRIESGLGDEFEAAAQQAGDLNLSPRDIDALDQVVLEATANDERLIGAEVSRIKDDMKDGKLPQKSAGQFRTRLGRMISTAANSGDQQRAASLGDIQDVLDERMFDQLSGDMQSDLIQARYQYGLFKALQRSTSTTTQGGKVNLRSFMTSLQRRNRWGSNTGQEGQMGEQFYRSLETLSFLNDRVTPSSGTSEGMLFNLANSIPGIRAGTLGQ